MNINGALPFQQVRNISLGELGSLAPATAYPLEKQSLKGKAINMPKGANAFAYPAVKSCIYCGSTVYSKTLTRELGEEHVIPGGLGAALVLLEASCQKHERATSGLESRLMQSIFDPTRKHHDIRGKKQKPMLKGKFPVFRTVDGVDIGIPLPIKDHPTVLFLPRLGVPSVLSDRPAWLHGIVGAWVANINVTNDLLKRQRITSYSTPAVDTILLAQVLFKIGHAFACAEVHRANFEPLLLDYILSDFKSVDNELKRYVFLGGEPTASPPTPYLHELGIYIAVAKNISYLVVRVRLLAYLGTPAYSVVVGVIKPDKLETVRERLTQTIATNQGAS